jgi:hypothetical protein
VMIEIIGALVRRAFDADTTESAFFLDEAKRLAVEYLGNYLLSVPGTPRG